MTDHANELRRHARKIVHPAGDVPAVMDAAADWIEHLQAKSEAAEKERDATNAVAVSIPEGWKLVPIKPTIEMLRAGHSEWIESAGANPCFNVYRAMLAAAPEAKP